MRRNYLRFEVVKKIVPDEEFKMLSIIGNIKKLYNFVEEIINCKKIWLFSKRLILFKNKE